MKQQHLDLSQKQQLKQVLIQHNSLFSDELGQWKGEEFTYLHKKNATPYHGKPYCVHHSTLCVFKHKTK